MGRNLLIAMFVVMGLVSGNSAMGQGSPKGSLDIRAKVKEAMQLVPRGRKTGVYLDQILVKYKPAAARAIEAANTTFQPFTIGPDQSAVFLNRIGDTGWILWNIDPTTNLQELSTRLDSNPDVVTYQRVNRIYPLIAHPNDADYDTIETSEDLILGFGDEAITFRRLWHFDDINAEQAWTIWPNQWYTAANKPAGPLLAVIDTGCDMNHPDFIGAGGTTTDSKYGGQLNKSLSKQFKFGALVTSKPSTMDSNGHGTHVTGLALAGGNNGGFNGHGTIGTGYNGRGMVLRVFDNSGNGSDADAGAAIYYAADKGASIINLSLGTENYSQLFQDAVTYAFQKGCLVVCAGNEDGNGGGDLGPIYPAACSGALAVTANGPNKIPANDTYTGYGSYLCVAAPGGNVVISSDFSSFRIQYDWSTTPTYDCALSLMTGLYPPFTKEYSYLAGTSMACPVVSGAATLYYGKNKLKPTDGWSNVRAYQAIERSAENVMGAPNGSWELTQGYGSLDMEALMMDADARTAVVGSIQGIVYYGGTPVAHVSVKAQKAGSLVKFTTTTLADGTYRYDQIPPGIYTVTAAPFGSLKSKLLVVKAGCDNPGNDFWAGTYTGDDTPPVAAKLDYKASSLTYVTVAHWGYDTETGIDEVKFRVGTTLGGSEKMADKVYAIDTNKVQIKPLTLAHGGIYYVRATYKNGAGMTTTKDVQFTVP